MLIVYGQSLLNKRDFKEITKLCPHCGQMHNVASFFANRWFNLYGIPLIPEGRRRIVDFCDRRNEYFDLAIKDWYEKEGKKKKQVKELLQDAKTNAAKAVELHMVLESDQPVEKSYDMAKIIESDFPDSLKVMEYLASWYTWLNFPDDAVRIIEKLNGNIDADQDHLSKLFIVNLLRKGDYEKSYEQLERFEAFSKDIFQEVLMCANRFCSKKEYKKAHELYKLAFNKFSGNYVANYNLRKNISKCEEHLGLKQTISLPKTKKSNKSAKADRKVFMILGGIGVLFVAILYFYLRNNNKTFFSNQTSSKAAIQISDGSNFVLNPGGFLDTVMPSGIHEVQVKLSNGKEFKDTLIIEDGLFDVIFSREKVLYDVAGAGVYLFEEITYAQSFQANYEDYYEIYTGKSVYNIDVSYPFEEAPETVELKNGSSVEVRTRWSMLAYEPIDLALILFQEDSSTSATKTLSYMKNQIDQGYDNERFQIVYDSLSLEFSRLDSSRVQLTEQD